MSTGGWANGVLAPTGGGALVLALSTAGAGGVAAARAADAVLLAAEVSPSVPHAASSNVTRNGVGLIGVSAQPDRQTDERDDGHNGIKAPRSFLLGKRIGEAALRACRQHGALG